MKKKFVAIAALVMSVFMGMSVFGGCDLITQNTERDLNQVVATVNIGNDNFETEKIYKQDMIMGYLNYGYSYVQNGYSQTQVFEMILDNLINNRILVQYVMKYMEDNDLVADATKNKWDLERYLTVDEDYEAKYETVKSMNDLIDSYEEAEEELKKDTMWEEVRTVPADAANAEKELDLEEKKAYADAGVVKGNIGDDRNKAYYQVLKVLKNNALLGDSVTDIENSEYYANVLKGQRETKLIEKYEEIVKRSERANITFADLCEKYTEMYNDQKGKYEDDISEFESALSSASAQSPLFYNNTNGSYGYVYNLLLGVSSEQETAINDIETKATADYAAERRKILEATTVKDLRSTWIYSGYDFDGQKFTGDYTFTTPENSLPFQGTVQEISAATEDRNAEYRVTDLTNFGLSGFIVFMDEYLGINSSNASISNDVSSNVYRKANVAKGTVQEYDEKINELLFAFSTDSGSLNTYKGYVIAPKPDFDGKDQWVIEFANAGRELLTMGGNSYIIVASDYGWHIMFYSELLTADSNYGTLTDYLNHLTGETKSEAEWTEYYSNMLADWDNADEDFYLYTLATATANIDTKLNTAENQIVKQYKYNSNYIVKNEKAYKDLMTD